MNKLYNEEIKEKFLSVYDNPATQQTIRNVFYKTELVERILEKDLYDFNLTELGKAIENTNPYSKNVARSTGRFISQYITFAIENGYRESNINPLKGTDDEFYDKWVDKTRKIHFSIDEFHEILETLDNNQDKAMLYVFWEGLGGERFSQLQELTIDDIHPENNTVYIKQRDYYVLVSEECIKYLLKAHDEKTYYQYNQKTEETTEKELLSSTFIFKNVKSPRSQQENQPVSMSVLYNRIHAVREKSYIEILTPNSLKQSGIIYYCKEVYLKEGVLGYDQFAKVCEKYDWSVIENNGYRYFNTFLLKEFVNSDNFKELYNLDVEITKK